MQFTHLSPILIPIHKKKVYENPVNITNKPMFFLKDFLFGVIMRMTPVNNRANVPSACLFLPKNIFLKGQIYKQLREKVHTLKMEYKLL